MLYTNKAFSNLWFLVVEAVVYQILFVSSQLRSLAAAPEPADYLVTWTDRLQFLMWNHVYTSV